MIDIIVNKKPLEHHFEDVNKEFDSIDSRIKSLEREIENNNKILEQNNKLLNENMRKIATIQQQMVDILKEDVESRSTIWSVLKDLISKKTPKTNNRIKESTVVIKD